MVFSTHLELSVGGSATVASKLWGLYLCVRKGRAFETLHDAADAAFVTTHACYFYHNNQK